MQIHAGKIRGQLFFDTTKQGSKQSDGGFGEAIARSFCLQCLKQIGHFTITNSALLFKDQGMCSIY